MAVLTLGGLAALAVGNRVEPAADATTASMVMTDDERIELRALADIATVGVAGWGCDGPLRGSGFVVDGVTLTNRHLVAARDEVKVDQLVAPVILAVDRVAGDLDVATAAGVDVVELEFADANPAVGSPVVVAGHAGGGATVVVEGLVHLYSDGEPWGVEGTAMIIDAVTEPGFSGGPVLDRDGRVVGILQGYEPELRLTLAVPVDDLRDWVSSGESSATGPCDGGVGTSTTIGGD